MKDKVIAIVGPTASGKTGLSIEMALMLDGEVVSADSRQVYRGLDIGSGKVTPVEMRGVPHHLLDVRDPSETFSAAEYVRLGRAAMADILERKKIPILVGGTGFYMDALLGTISIPEVPVNERLREELSSLDLERLNEELGRLDPKRAETIDTKNPVRLVRSIEIATALGGVPEAKSEPLYDVLYIGIRPEAEELERRIRVRLLERIKAGMLDEAARLHEGGLSWERMEDLGLEYRYLARHLQGKISYEEMLSELESEIRRYAKRQRTWFKRNEDVHWFAPEETASIMQVAKDFLASRSQEKTAEKMI